MSQLIISFWRSYVTARYNLARSTPLLLRGDFRCRHVALFIFRAEFVIR